VAAIGRCIARLERLRLGARGKSKLINRLMFGALNKPFEPARTPFDWLSRDPSEVDKYMADPLCGFAPSTQLAIDLLDALRDMNSPSRLARIPRCLPILIISGSRDPVSSGTRSLVPLLAAYRAAGLVRAAHRFYPEARHELFNETNRNEVTCDLLAWLKEVTG